MVDAALISGWLSPTSLFVLLNIVIATIFLFSSAFNNKNHHRDTGGAPSPAPPHFGRVPSLFSRVVSFNYSSYQQYGPELPDPEPKAPLTRAPSLLSRVSSFNFSGLYGPTKPDLDPPVTEGKSGNSDGVERSPSLLSRVSSFNFQPYFQDLAWPAQPVPLMPIQQQPQQAEGKKGKEEPPKSRAGKKKKTAPVAKTASCRGEEEPPKSRAGKKKKTAKTASCRGEEEVDARADNFIKKFRQQLHMQRLESLMRNPNSAT